jgi:hypothetical protein
MPLKIRTPFLHDATEFAGYGLDYDVVCHDDARLSVQFLKFAFRRREAL